MSLSAFAVIRRVHWPQLVLLGALPIWFGCTSEFSSAARLFAWLGLNFLLLALAERLQPLRADWVPEGAHLRRDGTVLALNGLVDALAGAGLTLLVVHHSGIGQVWPLWLQIGLGIALAEFGAYWMHRLSHQPGWLWRVHLLHHRPERLNLANALTAHPLNALYDKLVRLAPLLLLGFSAEAVLLISAFGLTQNLVTHANIAGTLGPLNWLLGSAESHRLHHSTVHQEAGNFGTAVPLWDLLFGSFVRSSKPPQRVGVFAPEHYPGELELGRLLRFPFGP